MLVYLLLHSGLAPWTVLWVYCEYDCSIDPFFWLKHNKETEINKLMARRLLISISTQFKSGPDNRCAS